MSAEATSLNPAAAMPAPAAFLQRPVPVATILGAFLLLTVPILAIQASALADGTKYQFFRAYHITFGMTHFFITFALYADARHLAHFRSTAKNKVLYFVIPAILLVLMGAIGVMRVDPLQGYVPDGRSFGAMFWAFWVALAVMSADFSHSTRQSFGVLQLIKNQPGVKFPAWTKQSDRYLFLSLMLLELLTFLSDGQFDPGN
ncbi:MAG TPA: hypothetical protein VIG99_09955, partial [Myxococcaceae bacterium]